LSPRTASFRGRTKSQTVYSRKDWELQLCFVDDALESLALIDDQASLKCPPRALQSITEAPDYARFQPFL
jgi:hypothetical protein